MQTGFIAQEIAEIYPHFVDEDEDTGYPSVNYDGLIAPMFDRIKKLKEENDRLYSEIEKIMTF